MALFPLIYPTTCATEYFGGIEISMCTWSNIKWPCSIRLSRCPANSLNILPIRWRKGTGQYLTTFDQNRSSWASIDVAETATHTRCLDGKPLSNVRETGASFL